MQVIAPDLVGHEPVHFEMGVGLVFPNPPQRVVALSLWRSTMLD